MIYLMICQGSWVAVDNFIATLRSKIKANPVQPRHLITVRGVGCRLDR